MTLESLFSLTPRSPEYRTADPVVYAYIKIHGISILNSLAPDFRWGFNHQHEEDEVFFSGERAGISDGDYLNHLIRRGVPHIALSYDLTEFAPRWKELVLIFKFDATDESRILISTNTEQVGDETLSVGDNQFVMEFEKLDEPLSLFFIHAQLDSSDVGGNWFFKGIDGYVE